VIVQVVTWILVLLVLATALSLSLAALKFHRPQVALLALIPVILGLAGIAFGVTIPAPTHSVAVIAAILVGLLGVVGGNPITATVLAFAGRGNGTSTVVGGKHGGIIVEDGDPGTPPAEVLRGGTIIGYLERLGLIAAIVLGRLEIVAVLIAVKGLGRFSELDSPQVRERFIIGTLISLVWAGACALLIVL
jgi:hypothetical protein